jgi:hypothetical protein
MLLPLTIEELLTVIAGVSVLVFASCAIELPGKIINMSINNVPEILLGIKSLLLS